MYRGVPGHAFKVAGKINQLPYVFFALVAVFEFLREKFMFGVKGIVDGAGFAGNGRNHFSQRVHL